MVIILPISLFYIYGVCVCCVVGGWHLGLLYRSANKVVILINVLCSITMLVLGERLTKPLYTSKAYTYT